MTIKKTSRDLLPSKAPATATPPAGGPKKTSTAAPAASAPAPSADRFEAAAQRPAVPGLARNADASANFQDPGAKLSSKAQTALATLKEDASKFAQVDAKLAADPAFAIAALRTNIGVFELLGPALQQDKAVATVAVAVQGNLLAKLAPELRKDPTVVLTAIRSDPSALASADASLAGDRTFLTSAVAANPFVLEHADKALRDERAFMEPLVLADPTLLQYAGPTLLADEKLAKRAVAENPDLLYTLAETLPEAVKNDKATMLACVQRYGYTLASMTAEMKADKDVALAAVSQWGCALESAAPELQGDRDVVATAVRRAPDAIKFASEALVHDQEFVTQLCAQDPRVATELQKYGPSSSCIDAVLAAHPEIEQSRALLSARLAKAGIDFPERFNSYGLLQEVLANREGANPADKRPVAVYVFPKCDWNGAFTIDNMSALTRNYRVMYYEAATDTDFANDLRDATEKKKASVLVIGGHGDQQHTAFGTEDPAYATGSDEQYILDFSDKQQMDEAGVTNRVLRNASVILKSCSTGEGQGNQPNIANFVATLFPQANVYAPIDPDNNMVQVDARGKLTDPGYANGTYYTYQIRPKGSR